MPDISVRVTGSPDGTAGVPVAPGLFVDGPQPRLLGSRCPACGSHHAPPQRTCPYCGRDGMHTLELSAVGRLWAFTAVTAAPPGYTGPVPYGFGVVELEEGIRVVSRLTEPDPSRLTVGQEMVLVVDPLGTAEDGRPLVTTAFAPVHGGHL